MLTEKLTTYGWVDQGAGVVRIPIEDAMRLTIERGGVKVAPQPTPPPDDIVHDSSSGRMATRR